jgi:hypothetical protein
LQGRLDHSRGVPYEQRMTDTPRWRRVLEYVLSIGAYPGEPETRGGGRRVLVVAIIVGTLINIPSTLADLSAGYTWVAAINFFLVAVTPLALVAIKLRPHRFAWILTAYFVLVFVIQLAETTMFGGLLPSGLVVVFGLSFVLGAAGDRPRGGDLVARRLRGIRGVRGRGTRLGEPDLPAVASER